MPHSPVSCILMCLGIAFQCQASTFLASMSTVPDPSTVLQCGNILFQWADGLDNKNWKQVERCFSERVRIDYSSLGFSWAGQRIPAKEYVDWVASAAVLGSIRVRTQHLIGACHWTTLPGGSVRVRFQVTAPHLLEPSKDGSKPEQLLQATGTNTAEFVRDKDGYSISSFTVDPLFVNGDIVALLKAADET